MFVTPTRASFPEAVESMWSDSRTSVLRDHGFAQHQAMVASYVSPDTPYRGLVLFHGLGTGKTSAAAAAIDVWRNVSAPDDLAKSANSDTKRVCIVTPAALRSGFVTELKRSANRANASQSSQTSKTSQNVVSPEDDSIDDSIVFINSNGLSAKVMKTLSSNGNALDRSLIIVDEAHNISRSLASASSKQGTGSTSSAGHLRALYNLIRSAKGSKVLLLTGTPIHNSAVEVAFLVNMVAGPLVEHSVRFVQPVTDDDLLNGVRSTLQADDRVDTYEVTGSGATVRLVSDARFRMPDKLSGVLVVAPPKSSTNSIESVVQTIRQICDCTKPTAREHELLPTDPVEFDAMFVRKDGALINRGILSRRVMGHVSAYETKAGAEGYPRVVRNEVTTIPLGRGQLGEYVRAREYEQRLESRQSGDDSDVSVYRHYTRVVSNFAFPPGKRGRRQFKFEGMTAERYEEMTERAAKELRSSTSTFWRDDSKLGTFAPKFLRIFDRISRKRSGKSMVYSTFRTWEGIGLFSELLLARGWRKIVLRGDVLALESTVKGAQGPCFVSPQPSERGGQILISLFNGRVDGSRSNIRYFDALATLLGVDRSETSNAAGHTVQAILLSKSGAEGINLTEVRQVHIMEPHWNSVQLDQVKGRAIRLNSHARLSPKDRTVSAFIYVATIPGVRAVPKPDKESGENAIDTKHTKDTKDTKDTEDTEDTTSALQKDKFLSTDEFVAQSAMKKLRLGVQILAAMKAAAVDCPVHASPQARECYKPPANTAGEANKANEANNAVNESQSGNLVPARIFDDRDDPVGPGRKLRVPVANTSDQPRSSDARTRDVIVYKGSSDVFDAGVFQETGKLFAVGYVNRNGTITWTLPQSQAASIDPIESQIQ